jgi:hypothetical protein
MKTKNTKLDTSDPTKLANDIIDNLGPVTRVDKGELVANMAISYIKIINDLNNKHIENLKKTLALLEDIKKEEKEEKKKEKISKLEAELNK